MRRTLQGLVLAVLLASLLISSASAQDTPRFTSIVIVLAPYLEWSDLADGTAPTIAALADRSAIANANLRNGSLGAAPDGLFGAAVLSAVRPITADEAGAVIPGEPLGALGEAVRAAGGSTIAVGTPSVAGDSDATGGPAAALVVGADRAGRVDVDATGVSLAREDADAPLGITADPAAFALAYRVVREADPPRLIVVDAGETERARAAAPGAEWDAARVDAVRTTDAIVGGILGALPADSVVAIVSTASYRGAGPGGFGPVIVYADGPGILTSSSTRRDGVVTLPDVAVTALALVGVEAPAGTAGVMLGVTDRQDDLEERLAAMRALDVGAGSLEQIREPAWFGYIGLCVFVIGLAALEFVRLARKRPGWRRDVISWALVGLLAVPPGSLVALVLGRPDTPEAAWIGLACGTAAVMAIVLAWKRRDPVHALVRLAFLTLALLLADLATGGHLSTGSAFSYSTLFGARYYGLGNEGAAVGFGALLAGVGWRMDHYGENRARGFLVGGAVAVVTAVLPFIGANVGVAAWGTAACVAAYLYGSRTRPSWRIVGLALAAAVMLVGVAVVADRAGSGSHLGSFVRAVQAGGGGLGAMLARKVEISFGSMKATPLVVLLPLGIGMMGYLVSRPRGRVGAVLEAHRGVAAAWVGTVTAALIALVTEDSAVGIGALLMLYALASFGVIALAGPTGRESA